MTRFQAHLPGAAVSPFVYELRALSSLDIPRISHSSRPLSIFCSSFDSHREQREKKLRARRPGVRSPEPFPTEIGSFCLYRSRCQQCQLPHSLDGSRATKSSSLITPPPRVAISFAGRASVTFIRLRRSSWRSHNEKVPATYRE